jgi:hypothetical protein
MPSKRKVRRSGMTEQAKGANARYCRPRNIAIFTRKGNNIFLHAVGIILNSTGLVVLTLTGT